MSTIYTIGYGNRSIKDFIDLLKRYHIQYLVDVRSAPYSKYNPDFSSRPLQAFLHDRNIAYLYLGDQLGGRPKDPDCYTDDNHVDYERCETKAFYLDGIGRLEKASVEGHSVVVMCSELRPEECHRSKLIGRTLVERGIPVQHIDENGDLKSQGDIINLLEKKLGLDTPQQMGLFNDTSAADRIARERLLTTSRNAYVPDRAGEE